MPRTIVSNPPRVTDLLVGLIRVQGWTRELLQRVTDAGFEPVRDEWDFLCLPVDSEPEDLRQNDSVVRAFRLLANLGVAFARDYKQTYDPAFSARYLGEAGLLDGPIVTCAFDGKSWVIELAA